MKTTKALFFELMYYFQSERWNELSCRSSLCENFWLWPSFLAALPAVAKKRSSVNRMRTFWSRGFGSERLGADAAPADLEKTFSFAVLPTVLTRQSKRLYCFAGLDM